MADIKEILRKFKALNEDIKTFDNQNRVYSEVLDLNVNVTKFANGISISSNGSTKKYDANEENAKDLDAVAKEVYDILVNGLRNIDQRIENVLTENKLTER